jgi:large subunit ribosomal protein L24
MVRRPIKRAPIRKYHVRKGDVVQVIAGNDKGKSGEIIDIDRKKGRVTVKGVCVRWKHLKKSPQNPQGGRVQREMPIHVSNVLLFDAKANRGVRARTEVRGGAKVRVSVKSGEPFTKA